MSLDGKIYTARIGDDTATTALHRRVIFDADSLAITEWTGESREMVFDGRAISGIHLYAQPLPVADATDCHFEILGDNFREILDAPTDHAPGNFEHQLNNLTASFLDDAAPASIELAEHRLEHRWKLSTLR